MGKILSKFENLLNKIKIKQSLILFFILVFFVPFVVIASLHTAILYKTMREWDLKKAQSNLELTEQNFNTILTNVSKLSDRIYLNKQLHQMILTEYSDVQQVYEVYSNASIFEDYLLSHKEVSSIRIYTENQTLLDNQFIQKVNNTIRNYDWYEKALEMNGMSFWSYKNDTITKQKFLCNIRAIKSSSGAIVGVLVININPYIIQNSVADPSIINFIVYDYTLIYSSSDNPFSDYEQPLIKFLYQNDYSISKMTNMVINNEKVGIVAVDFYPVNSVSLKFEIINLIPIKQLIQKTRQVLIQTITGIILILVMIMLAIYVYSNYIDSRVRKITNKINSVVKKDFKISTTIGGNDEFEQIYQALRQMAINTDDLINKLKDETEKNNLLALQQSEISFKMLSNQINPHFLFNTLETIRMKAISTNDKDVANMLKLLASLLRYNLSVKGQPVPLKSEIESVHNYLAIQHTRFGERVSYDIDALCDFNEYEILPLLIQPIVENSFSHGLENKLSGGFIYILIQQELIDGIEYIKISVKDNGQGIDDDRMEEIREKLEHYDSADNTKSIGLINVQSRIKMFYGKKSGLSIESEIGEGTTVTLRICCKKI